MLVHSLETSCYLVLLFTCISVLISSLEYVANSNLVLNNGFLDWEVIKLRHKISTKPNFFSKAFDYLSSKNKFLVINIFRVVLALFIISIISLGSSFGLIKFLIPILTFLTLYFSVRLPYGQDGADQLSLVVLFGYTLAVLSPTFNMKIYLGFIAFQGWLSYLLAGIAKLFSKDWRSGNALLNIFSLKIYGNQALFRFFKSNSFICTLAAWFIILFEVGAFALPFVPPQIVILYIALAIGFHAFNTFFMGLNTFFWSFLAVHPAMIYCSGLLHG